MGGLSLVRSVLEVLPSESLIYFGDTAHMPYGRKSLDEVQAFSVSIAQYLISQGVKALVIACNTATAAAINLLRQEFPQLPILGMEPALKPAVLASNNKVIAVLATQVTFRSPRYAELMDRFGYDVKVLEDPCIGLVERIESGDLGSPAMESYLRSILEPMLAQGADTIVLGCTHYPFVRPCIERIVGPTVRIIDPAPAVANHLRHRLKVLDLLNPGSTTPSHRFLASGPAGAHANALTEWLGLSCTIEAFSWKDPIG
ncbi:UNVERIFIED_CONTAM: hypothetical protein GTU68_012491 [Idotea baltica]|nr:hypothetical protein [Idotea baltica]